MNRPTERPSHPIGAKEIIIRAEQHFIGDKAPRGVNFSNTCSYGSGCGCFIGFMLTREDANKLDNSNLGPFDSRMLNDPTCREILGAYFSLNSRNTLAILCTGQIHHDEKWFDEAYDRQKTFDLLRQIVN